MKALVQSKRRRPSSSKRERSVTNENLLIENRIYIIPQHTLGQSITYDLVAWPIARRVAFPLLQAT